MPQSAHNPDDLQQLSALLDQVRGVLFAMSNGDSDLLSPVSTLAIRQALLTRNVSAEAAPLLETLNELRDVQSLKRGHWLPVHSRVVPFGDVALLVSGQPTAMLNLDYGIEIQTPGLGRLLTVVGDEANLLPTESLNRWLEAPASTTDWCEQIIRTGEFGEPAGVSEMEVYDHWSHWAARRWVPASSCNVPDGVIFARHVHLQTKATNHYLLRFRNSSPKAMHELPHGFDSLRLGIALRRQAGNSPSFSLCQDIDGKWELRGPAVPRAEFRLLRALGPTTAEKGQLTSRPPNGAVAMLRDTLTKLGLTERR